VAEVRNRLRVADLEPDVEATPLSPATPCEDGEPWALRGLEDTYASYIRWADRWYASCMASSRWACMTSSAHQDRPKRET